MASNFISPNLISSIERWDNKLNKRINISCPTIVKDYQNNIRAVDLFDQRTSYYDINRRPKINWFKTFQKFIEIASFNPYLCFIDKTGSKIQFIEFLDCKASIHFWNFISPESLVWLDWNSQYYWLNIPLSYESDIIFYFLERGDQDGSSNCYFSESFSDCTKLKHISEEF